MKVLTKSETGYVLEASPDEYLALDRLSAVMDGRWLSEQYQFERSLMPYTRMTSAFDAIAAWVRLATKAEELRHAADSLDEALQRR